MKRVTQALTAWNIFAPAVSLGGMLFVDLSPWVDWGDLNERYALPFLYLGIAWMVGTPGTAGLALLLNRWVGDELVKRLNIGLLLFWLFAAPLVVLRTFH